MKYIIKQIELLCKAIARMRAGNRCEICGKTAVHLHHIFFGARKSDWRSYSSPDFYASLCPQHHLYAPESPHKDNQTFLAIFLPKIEQERRQAIMAFDEDHSRPPKPDYKAIHANLKRQYEEIESICWMDADCEPAAWQGRPG